MQGQHPSHLSSTRQCAATLLSKCGWRPWHQPHAPTGNHATSPAQLQFIRPSTAASKGCLLVTATCTSRGRFVPQAAASTLSGHGSGIRWGPCAVSRRCRQNALLLPHSRSSKGSWKLLRGSLGRVGHLGRAAPCPRGGSPGGCPPWRPHKQAASMANPDCMPRCAPAWVGNSTQPSRLCCMCHNCASQTAAASPMCKVETQTQQLVHAPAMESHCARCSPVRSMHQQGELPVLQYIMSPRGCWQRARHPTTTPPHPPQRHRIAVRTHELQQSLGCKKGHARPRGCLAGPGDKNPCDGRPRCC